jgi:hypothetical protein
MAPRTGFAGGLETIARFDASGGKHVVKRMGPCKIGYQVLVAEPSNWLRTSKARLCKIDGVMSAQTSTPQQGNEDFRGDPMPHAAVSRIHTPASRGFSAALKCGIRPSCRRFQP